jgi:hypothetical protein
MSDEPKRRSWKWIGWAGLALIALNPLSFGPAVALNRATEDGFYKPMWMLADSKLFGDIHWSLSLFLAGHIRSVRPLATWALALNFCR